MIPRAETWRIYWVKNCRHVLPSPDDKFVIVVCRDPDPRGFFINTAIRPFVLNSADLLACQADIESSNHPCLRYDSYVDCTTLYEFSDRELKNERDLVSLAARGNIRKAVENSKTISTRHKKMILGQFRP